MLLEQKTHKALHFEGLLFGFQALNAGSMETLSQVPKHAISLVIMFAGVLQCQANDIWQQGAGLGGFR